MFSKKDLQELRGMFHEQNGVIEKQIYKAIQENNEVFGAQLTRDIRDEVHSLIKASEAGLIRRMDERFHSTSAMLIRRMDEGFGAITELIDDGILPQINEHEREIRSIKRHLKPA